MFSIPHSLELRSAASRFAVCASPVRTVPAALKLVKDAVILIQRAQLASEVFVNLRRYSREGVEVSNTASAKMDDLCQVTEPGGGGV